MKKKLFSVILLVIAVLSLLVACKNNEETQKTNYTYSNDSTDAEIQGLLKALLNENAAADSILYDVKFPLKVNNSGTRYTVVEGDAINSKGQLTGKNTKTEDVTIQCKYKGEFYYFKLTVPMGDDKDTALLKTAGERLILFPENIKGNITLVDTIKVQKNITVKWTSSNTSIITDKATGDNGEIPAGVVTRDDKDETVKLTAVLTLGGKQYTKEIDAIVKAKPEPLAVRNRYLYSYFRGNIYGKGESQKIHMSASTDGFFWKELYNNEAILTNTEGTGGVRDPYLIRSNEGDHFYLIGTDLDANGGKWGEYGNNGSLNIVVWESDDLINWSEVRLIEIAPIYAGCMWAPEATYDPTTGEYVVYFASSVSGPKKIFYVTTRDFYHFSEPKIYKNNDKVTYIDTTMTYYDGVYYRFTKNENELTILLETSDKVLGEYSLVKTKIAGIAGVEGPAIYKIDGLEKWVLYVDGYAGEYSGVGYFPLIANSLEDLKAGNFIPMAEGTYEMPDGAKHGSFLTITEAEYNAIVEAFGIEE